VSLPSCRSGFDAQSDAICTGLQLTNFWQDVALDWTKGRIYVPREDLERFGVSEAQVAAVAWMLHGPR